MSFLVLSHLPHFVIRAQTREGGFVFYRSAPVDDHASRVLWCDEIEDGYRFTDQSSAESFAYIFDNLEFDHLIEGENDQN